MDACEVIGVMADAFEFLYAVVASHIPPDVMGVSYHYLGYRSRPTATANYGYFTTIKQFAYV